MLQVATPGPQSVVQSRPGQSTIVGQVERRQAGEWRAWEILFQPETRAREIQMSEACAADGQELAEPVVGQVWTAGKVQMLKAGKGNHQSIWAHI